MTKFIRITLAPLALVALIAACGKSDDVAADSRQVELAPSAAGQPQLGDTAEAPSTTAAAEAPAAKVATAPKPSGGSADHWHHRRGHDAERVERDSRLHQHRQGG